MLRQKNAELHSIADVVCSNTGMTKEALLHDTHTYRIDGLETAAQIIRDGIKAGKIFYIMGDFDVDGIMASAGMVMGLGRLHAKNGPSAKTFYGGVRTAKRDCNGLPGRADLDYRG